MFRNGKIIVIGGTTESIAKAIFDSYMKDLADLGHPINYTNYKIQNIVACYKHLVPVSLENIAKTFGLEYNPELFPAVRYRDNDRKVTANICHTGSCVILGVKDIGSIGATVEKLKDILCRG